MSDLPPRLRAVNLPFAKSGRFSIRGLKLYDFKEIWGFFLTIRVNLKNYIASKREAPAEIGKLDRSAHSEDVGFHTCALHLH